MNKRYTTVDNVIKLWNDTANKKGYVLNERYSKKFGKPLYEIAAKSVILTMGRCPCLPRERPVCPFTPFLQLNSAYSKEDKQMIFPNERNEQGEFVKQEDQFRGWRK